MTDHAGQRPGSRPRLLLAALLTTTILSCGGVAWSLQPAAQVGEPLALPSVRVQAGFADLVAKVKPAVVNIATTELGEPASSRQMTPNPRGRPSGEIFRRRSEEQEGEDSTKHALGSGFIIDPSGYIVTSYHVVEGARKVTVTLNDGESYPATVKGHDEKTDMALLKIDVGAPLPFVSFGSSAAERVGDWVIAIGNPFGLGGSVTAGIISANGRDLNVGPYDDYLQIDAPINPGNSGGPLFNQSGQVIGIDTAIYSPTGGSVGVGFAIPSDLASKVVAQLRDTGSVERGWLGVEMQPLTPTLAKAMGRPTTVGALVNQVEVASPAGEAKLQQGDLIVAANGAEVKSPRSLALIVADAKAGSLLPLTVWRDGQEQSVTVTIGSRSKEQPTAKEEPSGRAPVGMALAALSPESRSQLGIGSSVTGVVVAQVAPDSRASESGMRAGDVILRVGADVVATPSEAVDKIRSAEQQKKEAVPLLVMRGGSTRYLALQLSKG